MPVQVKSYASPSLVLLAFHWPDADLCKDFAGYGIERTPGFEGAPASTVPIRCGYWWDSGITEHGARYSYRVVPMVGAAEGYSSLDCEAAQIDVDFP